MVGKRELFVLTAINALVNSRRFDGLVMTILPGVVEAGGVQDGRQASPLSLPKCVQTGVFIADDNVGGDGRQLSRGPAIEPAFGPMTPINALAFRADFGNQASNGGRYKAVLNQLGIEWECVMLGPSPHEAA
jgi:hypothetical protein